jgi:hypothetical protein
MVLLPDTSAVVLVAKSIWFITWASRRNIRDAFATALRIKRIVYKYMWYVWRHVKLTTWDLFIIIISQLQSIAGHRTIQLLAISLDLRLLASSSCQSSCANRHSAWPEGVLRRGLHSKTRLPLRLSVLRLIWPAHYHFSVLIRCAMSVTLVYCRTTSFRIWCRVGSYSLLRDCQKTVGTSKANGMPHCAWSMQIRILFFLLAK